MILLFFWKNILNTKDKTQKLSLSNWGPLW